MVHLQSGHGLDDVAIVEAGARTVIGVDYSAVTTGAANRRAAALGLACRYVVAELPGAPLRDGCADLVYTGKGALIWMRDLAAWARDVARPAAAGGSPVRVRGAPGGRPVELGRRRAPDPGRPELLR
ncbi:methyltransferase domain-containing protein [Micromonospora sp. PTRAS2]